MFLHAFAVVPVCFFLLACQAARSSLPPARQADSRRQAQGSAATFEEMRRAREKAMRGEIAVPPSARRAADEDSSLQGRVDALLLAGRSAEVLELVEREAGASGTRGEHQLMKADAYRQMQRPQLAFDCSTSGLELANAVLANSPKDPGALSARARALAAIGKPEEVAPAIEAALEVQPQDRFLQLLGAVLHAQRGDAEAFSRAVEQAAPRSSAPLSTLLRRAEIEKASGFPEQALETLAPIEREAADPQIALALAAGCHGDLGRFELEYQLASKALELQPNSMFAVLAQSEALIHLGHPELALQSLDRAFKVQGDLPLGYFLRAVALVTLNRTADALAAFRASIRQWPRDADVHANLAKLFGQMGDWGAAVAACDEALRWNPQLSYTHSDRASALLMLGRAHEAEVSVERALELDPENAYALRISQILRGG